MDPIQQLPGQEISLDEARRIMNVRKEYFNKMELALRLATGILHDPAVTNFYLSKTNGFLFSKEELQKLLDSGASYYMVIAGAHPEKTEQFEKGDPTVMVIPCRLLTKDDCAAEEGGMILEATGLAPQGTAAGIAKTNRLDDDPTIGLEHPPATDVTQINYV
ncbi:MAG: hypothetical protein JO154_11920 [Chitinophaga sp.]|uniref:hypothetical protein n=1 Tax=Chitinophaga sp. TaxID=1869181 RepID=UPI0025C05E6F|nr:hypothetical protein [Chitinophaga sp.]MBV8253306.1 hypothetical protein [Chitinophaga sp.]